MPADVTIELDPKEAREFFSVMKRAQRTLGRSGVNALQWGGRLFCRSMAARTKIVKAKERPVVQNPDPRWQTDKRRAPFGVMGWRDGKQRFIPIYRTGEYGKLRFYDRESVSWYERAPKRWRRIKSGPDVANPELIVPSIMDNPKRKIPRRGLAKKTWRAAAAKIGSGGQASAMGVTSVASVFINRDETDPFVQINNKLRYALDALKAGPQSLNASVNEALVAASRRMDFLIDKRLGNVR